MPPTGGPATGRADGAAAAALPEGIVAVVSSMSEAASVPSVLAAASVPPGAAAASASVAPGAAAAAVPPIADLGELVQSLTRGTALVEAAVLAACLLVAALAVRLWRGTAVRPGSVWFGDRIVDGALFALLALGFVVAARWALPARAPAVLLPLAVPVLVSLLAIRLTARVLRRALPDSAVVRVAERSVSWFAWVLVALWITGLLPLVRRELDAMRWKIGASQVSLAGLVEGLITAAVVLVLVLWLSSVLEARLLRGGGGASLSVRKIAANTLRALMLFVGAVAALSAAGIDLTALGVLGGAIGVGIGFGLQKLASNYVSGFVILAERSMRIGDTVKVDGFEGRITDITTRYTVIRALNGRESIVPNEMMITQRVENSSLADPKVMVSTTVQVAYDAPLTTLLPQLADAVGAVPRVLADPAPGVLVQAFAADGIELLVVFWILDPENGQNNVRSAANLALWRTLQDAGVEIPYPQRVLHRKRPPR